MSAEKEKHQEVERVYIRRAYFFDAALIALLTPLVYGLHLLDPRPPGKAIDLLFWGGLIAWSVLAEVNLPFRASISQLFLVLLAALLVFPLWIAPILAFLFYTSPKWRTNPRYSVHADLFNRAQNALAIAAAAYVYYLATQSLALKVGGTDLTHVIAIILAGSAFFIFNAGLVLLMIAIYTGAPLRKIWRENFSLTTLSYALLTPVALLIARLYTAQPPLLGGWGGWALILFLVPLYFSRYHWDELVKVKEAMNATLETIVSALDARDQFTRMHSERVAAISRSLAEAIKLDPADVEKIVHGARIHDVGKIAIPDKILLKPGKLTEKEFDVIKTHPERGVELMRFARGLDKGIYAIIRHHHERWDGRGYPDGLAGQEIPLWARIVSLADAYEAMTAGRPYKPARTPEEALKEIKEHAGHQFDPKLVKAFEEVWNLDPAWKDREVFLRNYSSPESSPGASSPSPSASDSKTSKPSS